MVKAVIFDMDGLLIDSEPVWTDVEVAIFGRVGVPLTAEMTKQTMALRADEVVRYWHTRYPWKTPSQHAIVEELFDTMAAFLEAHDIAMPGAHDAVAKIENANLPKAIASSSPERLIKAAMERLGISHKMRVIYSAEHEQYGKPHPGVYITTAKKLGVHPTECLAFEDSPNGVLAAKAAKMTCIAVPDEKMEGNPVYGIADKVLHSLEDFTVRMLEEL